MADCGLGQYVLAQTIRRLPVSRKKYGTVEAIPLEEREFFGGGEVVLLFVQFIAPPALRVNPILLEMSLPPHGPRRALHAFSGAWLPAGAVGADLGVRPTLSCPCDMFLGVSADRQKRAMPMPPPPDRDWLPKRDLRWTWSTAFSIMLPKPI
jgi:hypothetical protein